MKTFLKHLVIDYKVGLRDRTLLLMSYLFPLTFFLFMGFVMTEMEPEYKDIMYPSMLLFSLLTSTVIIVPNVVANNRETGIYRSFKIYGVRRVSIIFLSMISNLINFLIVSLIITILSGLYFKVSMPNGLKEWLYLVFVMILAWLVFITLAILIGNVVKNSKHVILYSQLIYLPSILLGGIMMDVKQLPQSIRNISYIMPSSHAMGLINNWTYHRGEVFNSSISTIILLILGLSLLGMNFITFKYDNQNSK